MRARRRCLTEIPGSLNDNSARSDDGVALLQHSGVERIVSEATGGWETPGVSALAVAKLPVVVVNPKQVRDFAKAMGHFAKTDKLRWDDEYLRFRAVPINGLMVEKLI